MKKKGRVYILSLCSCLALFAALFASVIAYAGTKPPQRGPSKYSATKYMKQQQRDQKKAQHMQEKAVKQWRKRHHVGH